MGYEVRNIGGADPFDYGLLRLNGNVNAPTLIHLGGSYFDMLNSGPEVTALPYLLIEQATPSFNVVSLDLPCHGEWAFAGCRAGLDGWYDLACQGVDFMALLTERVKKVKADMIAEGLSDAGKFAIDGISRGGFAALHCARAEIAAEYVAISPVINLKRLSEFADWSGPPPMRLDNTDSLNVLRWYPPHVSISNLDSRVNADTCEVFVTALRNATTSEYYKRAIDFHRGEPSLPASMDPAGHSQIVGEPLESARWILRRMGLPAI